MSDIAALKAALDKAEAAKAALVAERVAKRDELSKAAFRAYNADTRVAQLEAQAAVTAAQQALTAALNTARQELLVGTIHETERSG